MSNGLGAKRLVLLAHGSSDPRWCQTFESLTEKLEVSLGSQVCLAYMEMAAPTLMDVAASARNEGVEELRILPLFMAGGGHVSKDIPRLVDDIRGRYPEMAVRVLPPVGEHASVVNAMLSVAQASLMSEAILS